MIQFYHMALLGKKSAWQRVTSSRFTLLVLIVLIVGLSFAVYDRYAAEREVSERRQDKERELQVLEERQAVLEEKVRYLENDQGLEAEIRRHFDVAKEGEQVVVLVGERTETTAAPPLFQETEVESGFWSWLWPW